jgi:hypothetical protein
MTDQPRGYVTVRVLTNDRGDVAVVPAEVAEIVREALERQRTREERP